MIRRIAGLVCGVALLTAMLPAGMIAAKNPQKAQIKAARQDAKRLKAEKKALRSEVKAAKAKGKLSAEDRAKFKAERDRLKGEINGQKETK